MLTKILLSVSAIALSATPAVSASADGVTVTTNAEPRATVAVADLNIASPEGVARLKRRVDGAATQLCLTSAVEPIEMRVARAECYRAAISSGHRQIDRIVASEGHDSIENTTMIGR
jgi:UrcA family protein